jgi:hypothetical protein
MARVELQWTEKVGLLPFSPQNGAVIEGAEVPTDRVTEESWRLSVVTGGIR